MTYGKTHLRLNLNRIQALFSYKEAGRRPLGNLNKLEQERVISRGK